MTMRREFSDFDRCIIAADREMEYSIFEIVVGAGILRVSCLSGIPARRYHCPAQWPTTSHNRDSGLVMSLIGH